MQAAQFVESSRDPEAWRKHAQALRRAANVLWDEFERVLLEGARKNRGSKVDSDLDETIEALEVTKLLYGLTLETALKAWIIRRHPDKVEVRVVMDGSGRATQAELRAVGVPISSGHNLLALAEVAGLFDREFQSSIRTEDDKKALRNICRDLGEVVLWRGRYPVPLSSFEPMRPDPSVPRVALVHYMRDWLDPVLDALLAPDEE